MSRVVVVLSALLLLVFGATSASGAPLAPCAPSAIGVDIAGADTVMYAYYGRGIGQVFYAADTLIHAISVWRPADPVADAQPRYLFITEVDQATGIPLTTFDILLTGPSLVMGPGDGISPVEYRFVLDPPFTLPGPGRYFFDILPDCFGVFGLMAVTTDPYLGGQAWGSGPEVYCDSPGGPRNHGPKLDLAFQIEFCTDVSTRAKPVTWGRLKQIYR